MLQSGIAGELSAQGQEYVAAILTSVERLGQQIENVLDLSQSEAGTLPLAAEPVELFPLVTETVKERADRITAAGITLDLRGSGAVGRITGDARRLRRALGQLVDNAIAATPQGGRILVQCERQKGKAVIVVSDSGKGMEPAALARALDGLRVSSDGKTLERRQGLGLPLARQLVEAHGGKLELISEPGQGTAAIVTLP